MPAFWMIVSCFLFACMGVCVKLASSGFSTGEIVFWRGAVSMAMMAGLALSQGVALRTPHWRMHLSRSLSGSTALVCYFFAIGALPLATAVTLNYTSPLFVALLLALFFRERLNAIASGAVMMGFAGVVVLLRPTLQPEQWLGAAAGLSSGAMASLAYISLRELGRAGVRVDIADAPLPRAEFYRRCASAHLVWSPEGQGWQCFRHYEAAACGSVPLMNRPAIRQHQPLVDGEHGLHYDPAPGALAAAIVAALADRPRLERIAAAGRDLVLRHHTHRAICDRILSAAYSSAAK